jgi:hypothetical protein
MRGKARSLGLFADIAVMELEWYAATVDGTLVLLEEASRLRACRCNKVSSDLKHYRERSSSWAAPRSMHVNMLPKGTSEGVTAHWFPLGPEPRNNGASHVPSLSSILTKRARKEMWSLLSPLTFITSLSSPVHPKLLIVRRSQTLNLSVLFRLVERGHKINCSVSFDCLGWGQTQRLDSFSK